MVVLGSDPRDRTMMVGRQARNQDGETHPCLVTDATLTCAVDD